jgi:6-phosphofructokinase 1
LKAREKGYDLRVIGVPKTIDNDLPHTDHCPGFGSVIKYNATTVLEVATDVGSMATDDGSCCIIEVMGRAAGWIAAGTILAKRRPDDAPHIILLPEIAFDEAKFLERVRQTVASQKFCIVVVGEGLKDANGEEVAADKKNVDAFGHPVLSGAAEYLKDLVQEKLKTKTRTVKLGYAQRAAGHWASQLDIDEAVACGEEAVKAAINGISGMMVKIIRLQNHPYEWKTDLHNLGEIANVEHFMPRDWITEDGFLPNEKFVEYARPLIQGEPVVPTENGIPRHARLAMQMVEKQLPPREA